MIGQHRRLHGRGFRILGWVALLSLLQLQTARAQDEAAPTTTLSSPDDPTATPSVPTCAQTEHLTGPNGGSTCEILNNVMTNCANSLNPPAQFSLSGVLNESFQRYPQPESESPLRPCECTESVYNLFSACAACQVGDNPSHWASRSIWFAGCGLSSQPPKIPPGNQEEDFNIWMTSVYDPIFNVTLAQRAATTNTAPPAPSGDTLNGSTASGSSTTTSSDSASSKKSNTGLIAGVVVGVVGLFALLALALFLYRRHQKKSRVPPSAEFMKYAQHDRLGSVNLPTASHPLMGNMGTAEDEEAGRSRTNLRGSVIRLDGTDTTHEGGTGSAGGGHTVAGASTGAGMLVGGSMERDGAPPAFSPGLFKDPIFEKGVALNLAGMSGQGTASGSPVTSYSPATPSSVVQNNANTENQRLIQGRHGTA